MQNYYNYISDGNMTDELALCFRNRMIEQKYLYQDEGAEFYYNSGDDNLSDSTAMLSLQDRFDFGFKNVFEKNNNSAFISLGCGNSKIEANILKLLPDDYNVTYFGIDSSQRMLDFSKENLIGINKDCKNVCVRADFSSINFKRDLNLLTESFDKRIFAFFSNTIGNINQTNIIDILYNLLEKGEKLWIDVRLKLGNDTKNNLIDFEKYYSYLSSDYEIKFFLNILNNYNIPYENGKLILSTSKEPFLNAIKYIYSFEFTTKSVIKIRGDEIIILPGEKIDLIQIYNYDQEGLIEFFRGHNFQLVTKEIKNLRGQFLFEKI